MPILHRTRKSAPPAEPVVSRPEPDASPEPRSQAAAPKPKTHTRISGAWVSVWTSAILLILLVVFMLQNTGRVEISFVGLHGTLPLAMALLIATVGGIVLTLVVGTARIAQLRRLARRRRKAKTS
jgi:uncharacterized integral membrane protein